MSITYRPPFDEDDERDLRALYRKPRPGSSPELDAAVRRAWHPGHSWHPGWAAAACAAMVAGLFAWTDMRESVDTPDRHVQLVASHDAGASADRSPAPLTLTDNRHDGRAEIRIDPRAESRTDAMASKPVPTAATSGAPVAAVATASVTARVAAPASDAAAASAPAQAADQQTAGQQTAQAGNVQATEATADSATAVAPFSDEDVEARVAHIRSLMQNDQQDDAVQALRELQQGAPDLTLPDDLQELAQQNPA